MNINILPGLLSKVKSSLEFRIGLIDIAESMPLSLAIVLRRCPSCDEVNIVAEGQFLFFGIGLSASFGTHHHETKKVRVIKGNITEVFLEWIMMTRSPANPTELERLARLDEVQQEFLKMLDFDLSTNVIGDLDEHEES